MITIRSIDEYITELCPRELSETWDNDGVMLCKNEDAEVKKAVVCLEIGIDVVKYAVEIGADLIITHHPFIFRPIKSLVGEKMSELELLVKNDISVLSYHTRYDKAKGGVNDILCSVLGLEDITEYGDFLRTGVLCREMNGEELARYIDEKLGSGVMKAYFEKDAKIKRVAVCGGAGREFVESASLYADAYISSDFSHETFREAKALGIAVFDAGHYYTENPAASALCDTLKRRFTEVSFDFFDVKSPFFTV